MASLAGMLQARGHHVTGSDLNVYPPMSTMLEQLGINVAQGYKREHLASAPDCVIVGNAIPRGNPEVEETLKRKILYRSPEPTLAPATAEERAGLVPNVVFPTGIDPRANGRVDIYYGMADSAIGVARLAIPAQL